MRARWPGLTFIEKEKEKEKESPKCELFQQQSGLSTLFSIKMCHKKNSKKTPFNIEKIKARAQSKGAVLLLLSGYGC